jgi:hypothetical protein
MYELITGESVYSGSSRSAHTIVENRLRFFKSKSFRKERLSKLSDNKQLKIIISKMLSELPNDRFESMRDVVQALGKVHIPSDEHIEIALDSYERCCIVNTNFVQDFYAKLFNEAEHKEDITAFFKNSNAPQDDKKRSKMLRVAIDLLINCKYEPEKLKKVLLMDIHNGIMPKLYHSFMQTIIATVEVNDPLWQQKTSRKKVELAWQKVAKSVYELL